MLRSLDKGIFLTENCTSFRGKIRSFYLFEGMGVFSQDRLRPRLHARTEPGLAVDAFKATGCKRIYQDVASGAKTARPALDELLGQLRAGDVLVIWKLARMGRSLKHLVEWLTDIASADDRHCFS